MARTPPVRPFNWPSQEETHAALERFVDDLCQALQSQGTIEVSLARIPVANGGFGPKLVRVHIDIPRQPPRNVLWIDANSARRLAETLTEPLPDPPFARIVAMIARHLKTAADKLSATQDTKP
jgi:hypothetical protein